MNIPQEIIDLARETTECNGVIDMEGARTLSEFILKEAGQLGPPQKVKVPDCLRDDHFIAIDECGDIYIFDSEPERTEAYWRCPDGISAIEIYESDNLILPKVHWIEACWQVSELHKMQAKHEEWEAQQAEKSDTADDNDSTKDLKCELKSLLNSFSRENASDTPDFILAEYMMKSLETFEQAIKRRSEWHGEEDNPLKDDDEYIVWKPGELPEQFRNRGYVKKLGVQNNLGGWLFGCCGSEWKATSYKMRVSDWNRLKEEQSPVADNVIEGLKEFQELTKTVSIEQLKKDHEAMEFLRECNLTEFTARGVGVVSSNTFRAFERGMNYEIGKNKPDPADAILAVKGGK